MLCDVMKASGVELKVDQSKVLEHWNPTKEITRVELAVCLKKADDLRKKYNKKNS